jgi:hypothetical protein
METVAIITGTVGNSCLVEAVSSVQQQRITDAMLRLEHWIVVDGAEHEKSVRKNLPHRAVHPIRVLVLPENTGSGGYLCHRINGGVPWLTNADLICFLDEDNQYERHHVEGLWKALKCQAGARWAFSLRAIVDGAGRYVTNDCCESLGSISHTLLGRHDRLIDTNCYMLGRELAVQICPLWNVKARQKGCMEADRQVCLTLLRHEPVHGIYRQHSVKYRTGNRGDSVTANFFVKGNTSFNKGVGGYNSRKPKKDIYVFHFDAERTASYMKNDPEDNPLAEWCPGVWHGLLEEHNLLDGFANINCLRGGDICIVAMCSPMTLPLDIFKERRDVMKILYTLEGPNRRHQYQWDKDFLRQHFDVILTYWKPLIEDATLPTILCPHNSRFLEFPLHNKHLRTNTGKNEGSVVMVLERRICVEEAYEINSTKLRCLDNMREKLVRGLKKATVIGNGWEGNVGGDVSVGYSMPRHLDMRTPIDHYELYDFALIVENCDASGYVSEKFADAMIAGTIPIYHGNQNELIPLPEGTYIDAPGLGLTDGKKIQDYLDRLTKEDVCEMKRRVEECRVPFLEARGRRSVRKAVDAAIDLCRKC